MESEKEKVMGLELFNTFILLLLVVAAVASLWVRDLLVSAVVFAYLFIVSSSTRQSSAD